MVMWKEHGEDFHSVGNDKFDLKKDEIDFLKNKLKKQLDENNFKIKFVVEKHDNSKGGPVAGFKNMGRYGEKIVKRKLRFDEEEKQFYIFYDSRKYWARPIEMAYNLQHLRLYKWTILHGNNLHPKKSVKKEVKDMDTYILLHDRYGDLDLENESSGDTYVFSRKIDMLNKVYELANQSTHQQIDEVRLIDFIQKECIIYSVEDTLSSEDVMLGFKENKEEFDLSTLKKLNL